MSELPLVSVVIPLYNHEKFVGDTIRSIIAQTYPRLELIVINDGSPDGSATVVEALRDDCEARFASFLFITQANRGVASSLNRGLGLARGEFVFLLASDDLAKPAAVETFLERMQLDDSIALVCGDLDFIDQQGQASSITRNDIVYTSFMALVTAHRVNLDLVDGFGTYETMIRGNYVTVGILLRRSSVLAVGGYDETYALEDVDLWLKLARRFKFAYVPQQLVSYRQHSTNTRFNRDNRLLYDEVGLLLRELDEVVARGLLAPWRERMNEVMWAARQTSRANSDALAAIDRAKLAPIAEPVTAVPQTTPRQRSWLSRLLVRRA